MDIYSNSFNRRSPMDTMITMGIIVFFVVVLGAFAARCTVNISGDDQVEAETGARDFASRMGLKVTGVMCARNDSDGDGYVSCTLAVTQPDGSTKMEAIECAGVLTTNKGCRMQKPGMVRAR